MDKSFLIAFLLLFISALVSSKELTEITEPQPGAFINLETSIHDGEVWDIGVFYKCKNNKVKFYAHHNFPATDQNLKHRIRLFADEKYLIKSGLILELQIIF